MNVIILYYKYTKVYCDKLLHTMHYNILAIYTNLKRLVETREWTKVEPFLNDEDFFKELRAKGYVKIIGTNRKNNPSIIVLTSAISDIANHKQDFNRVISSLKGEIILISNKVLSSGIREFANSLKLNVYSYTFDKFTIDMTKAPLVPPHSLVSKDEEAKILSFYKTEKKHLPSISINDTQCIWIGANYDDMVMIKRFSEATGYSPVYKIVRV